LKRKNTILDTETGVTGADDYKEYDLDDFSTDYLENFFKFLQVAPKSEKAKKEVKEDEVK